MHRINEIPHLTGGEMGSLHFCHGYLWIRVSTIYSLLIVNISVFPKSRSGNSNVNMPRMSPKSVTIYKLTQIPVGIYIR